MQKGTEDGKERDWKGRIEGMMGGWRREGREMGRDIEER